MILCCVGDKSLRLPLNQSWIIEMLATDMPPLDSALRFISDDSYSAHHCMLYKRGDRHP